MHAPARVAEAVDRLKGVFLEIPGTRVTVSEAVRLSGLDPSMCGIVLEALTDAGFLRRRPGGVFIQRSE